MWNRFFSFNRITIRIIKQGIELNNWLTTTIYIRGWFLVAHHIFFLFRYLISSRRIFKPFDIRNRTIHAFILFYFPRQCLHTHKSAPIHEDYSYCWHRIVCVLWKRTKDIHSNAATYIQTHTERNSVSEWMRERETRFNRTCNESIFGFAMIPCSTAILVSKQTLYGAFVLCVLLTNVIHFDLIQKFDFFSVLLFLTISKEENHKISLHIFRENSTRKIQLVCVYLLFNL